MSEPDPLQVFLAATAALDCGDWLAAARLCDPVSLRAFHRQQSRRFDPANAPPPVTSADIRRHQPHLPEAEAERQAAEINTRLAESRLEIGREFANVASYQELADLEPVELYARWLEANSLENELRRFVAAHPGTSEAALSAIPEQRAEAVGCLVRDHLAFVVYRRHWNADPDAAARFAKLFDGFPADEQAWLRESTAVTTLVVVLLRQPDGAWRMAADHWPVNGGAWVGPARLRNARDGGDEPDASRPTNAERS